MDHPRLRGEQPLRRLRKSASIGSPPLARGTVRSAVEDVNLAGITPACAGNSEKARRFSVLLRDHPRLRGEQYYSTGNIRSAKGSPPLARGTVSANIDKLP